MRTPDLPKPVHNLGLTSCPEADQIHQGAYICSKARIKYAIIFKTLDQNVGSPADITKGKLKVVLSLTKTIVFINLPSQKGHGNVTNV